MAKKENIVSYTAEEVSKLKGRTDWDRVRNMKDEDIDTSDIPELGEDFWKYAKLFRPSEREMISLRIDKDVTDWFRAQGKGYQGYMNAVLKAFVESNK